MTAASRAAASAVSVMVLTAAHHAYGAWRFDTPWRHHVVVLSLWVIAGLGACLVLYRRGPTPAARRAGVYAACVLILVAPVAWIGIFEGGFNHIVKDVLYFSGLSRDSFARLFPPPTYQPPSDWFFELTGVLQFPLGLLAGSHALRWWRTRGDAPPR